MRCVITADWHIRSNLPRCRKDEDWFATQEKALEQIRTFANEKRCPVFFFFFIFHSMGGTNFFFMLFI